MRHHQILYQTIADMDLILEGTEFKYIMKFK